MGLVCSNSLRYKAYLFGHVDSFRTPLNCLFKLTTIQTTNYKRFKSLNSAFFYYKFFFFFLNDLQRLFSNNLDMEKNCRNLYKGVFVIAIS
jgi:hypothetical protein